MATIGFHADGGMAFLVSPPTDSCIMKIESHKKRSAADSDVVWDSFLPPEYLSAISDPGSVSGYSSSSTTWSALSKKQLYFRACHNSIHKGKLLPLGTHLTRFPEVVEREEINEFEIGGKITVSLLSPMTTYVAYLVFAGNRIGDDPAEVAVGLAGSNNGQNRTVYFHQEHQDGDNDGFFPKKRADGWMESELGEFFNGGDEKGELLMTIQTYDKKFLLIQGIEIRPKKDIDQLLQSDDESMDGCRDTIDISRVSTIDVYRPDTTILVQQQEAEPGLNMVHVLPSETEPVDTSLMFDP
ncbi:hypothetical protein EZV62_009869 [Acer yangbiense]|uniref:Uncharacterized protein n=1 Tax=Acer yangbiense TaxID=1000413 RepID=A0A5C7I1C2_9ROSI|nr:hypothetical protein EZV62_009869 [Acer yangbiense]